MKLLVYILFFSFSFSSFGQIQRCSTDEYRESLKERGLYNYNKKEIIKRQSYSGNYTIPVVVHVLYNNEDQNISDDRIYWQIEILNEDYNALNTDLVNVPEEFEGVIGNVGLSFCLVQEDLNGNSFSGINRVYTDVESFQGFSDGMKKSSEGGVDAWDTENYLNIWVCDLNSNLLGFATMPGDVEDSELDGVVIGYEYFGVDLSSSSPYNLGRTGTHEVGHYFNLEHTFYSGCSDWDDCDDTPAISSPTYGCPSFPQESCQSNNMTMNYMDYTNDACMHMFTICQAERMIDALFNYRPNLIADTDCSVDIEETIYSKNNLIYPNPVVDFLHVDVQNMFVSLSDIYGRKIFSNYFLNESNLDLSFLSSGTYIISVGTDTYKLIKK